MVDIKKSMRSFYTTIRPSLIAVGIGLLIGLIILFIFNPMQAIPAMFTLLMGGFNGGIRGIGNMFYYATPIILTGLAVAFAFKTGLFNIGASGQMMIGAYVSIHIGVLWDLPGAWHWFVAIMLGMIAGGIWAFIPGLLKVISNVNEVVASIMMNYIAGHLVIIMIKNNVYNVLQARSMNVKPSAQLPLLTTLFPASTVNIGIIIAILIAILTHILIHKTTLGFQLRASGFSMDGSKYAGMNTKANIMIAMSYSGMLAGLAGALSYLVIGKTMPTAFAIFSEGFDGISVALLGLGEPIGALFAGLFLSHLRSGGFYMQLYDFVPEIIDIIIAVIIYVTAISAAIQLWFDRKRQKNIDAPKKTSSAEGGEV